MITHRLLPALLLAVPGASLAQSLDERIASGTGRVAFEFATRPNVCGDGYEIFISDDTTPGWNRRSRRSGSHFRHGSDNDRGPCDLAPARAVVESEGRRITWIRVSVGGESRRVESELGRVSAQDAARFLLAAAPRLDGRSADDGMLGAAIADVPRIWPRLIEIARDNSASEASRKASLFWLSNEAAVAATAALAGVAQDDDTSASVRQDAVFWLAQRKDGTGVEALIRIVRQSKSVKIRKDALWWLGQSRDPRALDLFAELLAGR